MLKRRNKWLSLLLTACLTLSCSTAAYADPGPAQSDAETISVSETAEETDVDAAEPAEEITEETEEVVEAPEMLTEEPTVDWKDHGDGLIDLSMKNYTRGSDVKELRYYVWSEKNGQDDLKAHKADDSNFYQMNTQDHKDDLGDYHVHVYEVLSNDSLRLVCKFVGNVASIDRPVPTLIVEDKDGEEKTFSLSFKNYSPASDVENVRVAIWSEKGGQDDLKWYTFDSKDGNLTYDFKPAPHKTAGLYHLHVYEAKKGGALKFVAKSTLEVSVAKEGTVTVSDLDQKKGTCKITITGVTCPSGITKVEFPSWSKFDQSDLVWYQATAEEDGSYTATLDVSKHKNNLGTYQIHAYAVNGNGIQSLVGKTTATFKVDTATVTAVKDSESVILETQDIGVPGGLSAVRYAVWSEEKGQDDLQWFETACQAATASAKYTISSFKGFKHFGVYQVHCYGVAKNGNLVLLGTTSFEVEKPALDDMKITLDNAKGEFTIVLSGLKSDTGITKVQIPVWSAKDQNDLVWYTATKDASGNYTVKSTIAKHKYNVATYTAHVYVTETNGLTSFLKGDTFTFEKTCDGVEVGAGTNQKTFPITAKNISIPLGAKSVTAAVWSDKDGQNDLKWYTLTGTNGGDYKGTIDISNHKTQGNYQVHVYANTLGGTNVFLGNTTFTVNSTAKATATVVSEEPSNGCFNLKITITDANSAVSKLEVPIWTKGDQSDIYWYTATKQSDGTYSCKVNIANHKLNLGNFVIHMYPTFTNGIRIAAGTTSYNFNPPNVLAVTKPANGSRKVTLKNAGAASKVQFAVWSDDKGQDDLVWYSGTKQSDGSWTATIKSLNHKSAGNYQLHCYVNDKMTCATTFSFAQSEMAKQGWYYENGYKFYYKDGKKLTNLTSIIGAQGSYVAKVNRTTCTITIYANDPNSNKGYIIPVIAFTCSVGLPNTPTTPGTHYTFVKYRWKELMGPSYGQYATKFTSDGIYFHSVAGFNTTSYNLNYIDYNNLGIPASHGCVRLCVRDAKWIYDNCPLGMKVIVYDSGDPGPYGKPATIKIPPGQTWDPTDPAIQ